MASAYVLINTEIGGEEDVIAQLKDMKEFDFGPAPHCLIIPGKLHFVEKEMLNQNSA